jgi:hypothetical protein
MIPASLPDKDAMVWTQIQLEHQTLTPIVGCVPAEFSQIDLETKQSLCETPMM